MSMSKEELDRLYAEELNVPYTPEEYGKHSKLRVAKSWLELTHARNYELIDLVDEWIDYFEGRGPKPERKLWPLLRPGNNNDNITCARIRCLSDFFGKYEYGETPQFPIFVYTTRSAFTLYARLEELFVHPSLCDIDHHTKELTCVIARQYEPMMSHDQFARRIHDETESLIASFAEYSKALCVYMTDMERKIKLGEIPLKVQIVPTADKVKNKKKEKAKKSLGRGPKTPFMVKQLETFLTFLKTHPVNGSHSLISRAHECWIIHRTEWDAAAKDKTGYANYKSLAQAV